MKADFEKGIKVENIVNIKININVQIRKVFLCGMMGICKI